MALQHANPITIDHLGQSAQITRLVRIRKSPKPDGGPRFVEGLLQQLVHESPSILPVEEIEPAFSQLRSVCKELPLERRDGGKFVDNLLISPDGRICLVECKLWRNPEAVRSAVAQILDYAGEMLHLSYEELVSAVRRAVGRSEGDPIADQVLGPDVDDEDRADFIDAVARSLQAGNFLLVVVGDGIRSDLQQISALLQNRATLGFSFWLIEMAIYGAETGSGPYYVQPRTLARTEIITRTVFVGSPDNNTPQISKVEAGTKPQTLSEHEFFADLAKIDPRYPDQVRTLFDHCRDLGCEPTLLRKYNLYVDDPVGGRINLGGIGRNGTVEIWGPAAHDADYGSPIGRNYMERVLEFLPNSHIKDHGSSPGSQHLRHKNTVKIPLHEMISRSEAWIGAIQQVIDRFRGIEQSQQPG